MATANPILAPVYKFGPATGFHAELKRRVDEHFDRTGQSVHGGARLGLKTAIIAAWLAASYYYLVFGAETWWQVSLSALSLGLAIAAVGFNIQHDGNHGSFSDHPWVSRLAGAGLDLLGGSSYMWRMQHNVLHHSYTNLALADHDIDTGGFGRLSPAQNLRSFHRFQQFYLWPLYATIALKWQWFDDFHQFATGRIGPQRIPRPRKTDLAGLITGKIVFLLLALVLPSFYHPFWKVLAVYVGTMLVVGFLLAVIFQLAHSVGEAVHPGYTASARIPEEWAVHQVWTTVDFARGNKLLAWYIGGLNFQVEHHLFPKISHVHYPAIAPIVEETCRRFGVRYTAHATFGAAIASHQRFLREMGHVPAQAA
jgi:linoleoyl-CoA desaturase